MPSVVFADLVGSTGIFERLGDETAGRFLTQLTTALAKIFEQHNGRVVKLLGDGLFVVFPQEAQAITACIAIQERLLEKPVVPGGGNGNPVQMQMGIESGEVVEIEGDCYGDAVNSAARLADLAGADQILTSQRVRDAAPVELQRRLRSLGPMYLRGKQEVTEVFRVDWQQQRDVEATVMGVSMFRSPTEASLQISAGGQTLMLARGERLTLGRGTNANLAINDSRVSRIHASVEWKGGHFILNDVSSFGTWVYFGNQSEPVVLRRTECYLVGNGQIALGCDRNAEAAPLASFAVT